MRLGHRRSFPKQEVFVVGPMSSGCRLLRDIIGFSPDLKCHLDTTHGTQTPPKENRLIISAASLPIVILRDEHATRSSQEVVWKGRKEYVPYDDSIRGIREKYPNAITIQYEDLCEDPYREIRRLAEYFEVRPWDFQGIVCENRNEKWHNGE